MAIKNFMQSSGIKAPKSPPKDAATGGVPGDSSRARMMESQGQKTVAPTSAPIAAPAMPKPQSVAVASGDNIVMPVNHPSAKTTRTVSKGGAL